MRNRPSSAVWVQIVSSPLAPRVDASISRAAVETASTAEPLESPRYRWLWWDWTENAYHAFEPPAVGVRVELDGLERLERDGTRGPVF